jgi:hypothetical protein
MPFKILPWNAGIYDLGLWPLFPATPCAVLQPRQLLVRILVRINSADTEAKVGVGRVEKLGRVLHHVELVYFSCDYKLQGNNSLDRFSELLGLNC